MFIPIGLILRGIQEVEDENFRVLMRHQDGVLEVEAYHERARELWAACTGPDACLLVIGKADWSTLRLDDVPMFSGVAPFTHHAGPYRDADDPLGPAPHGFLAVCAGVHVLTATVADKPIGRALRLAPGTARFVRVDPAGAFVDYEPEQREALLKRHAEGKLSLLDYNQTVGYARMHGRASRSSHEAHQRALPDLLEAYGCLARGDLEMAWAFARRAQIMLTGAPIPSFERVVKLVTDHATRLRNLQRTSDLRVWLELTSWVVPDLAEVEALKAALV